ncbi:MAG: ferredoxin, partial [Bacteroidales bacterium]|nr:ferredoxin [Bacteroidales bacterium]
MKTVRAVYFSATGTTRRVVCAIAEKLSEKLGLPYVQMDFTLPAARVEPLVFGSGDIVVLGTPVYAGRVPNVLLKYLQTLRGAEAVGVPVTVFGNRHYDDALIELRDLMENAGIRTVAAAAFVGEQAFSRVLVAGRPD